MNDYIRQLRAYRDDGVRPDAPFLQAMLQGDFQHALIIATPNTLGDIQEAWGWMLDNIPRAMREDWRAYERHCKSFEPTLEGNSNVL